MKRIVQLALLAAALSQHFTAGQAQRPTAADAKKIGSSISGFRYEFPCKGAMPDNPKPGADCDSGIVTGDPKKTDNFTKERKFDGLAGKHYDVTLRFRGVVEPMMYRNGKKDGDLFYIGGEPNNDTYNIYKLTISSPPSFYYLNRQDSVGHRIFTIDYQKTIPIDGDATVTFHGDGQNGRLIIKKTSWKLVVPDIAAGAAMPFNGQFVQVNIVDVVEMK